MFISIFPFTLSLFFCLLEYIIIVWIAMVTFLPFQFHLSLNYWICEHTFIFSFILSSLFLVSQWQGAHVWRDYWDVRTGSASIYGEAVQLRGQSRPHHPSCFAHGVSHSCIILSIRFCTSTNLSLVLTLSSDRMCLIVSPVWQFIISTRCLRPIRTPTTS